MEHFTTQVSARAFDGLLVVEPENTLDTIIGLHHKGLPVVLIDDRGSHPEDFPSVVTTNREEARPRPVICSPTDAAGPWSSPGPRISAVYATGSAASVRCCRPIWSWWGTSPSCRDGSRWRNSSPHEVPFDSVFAQNDISAAGAMRALRAAGRSVPGDIAVVGFDDIPMAQHTEPPLTTVHQPAREMGETAATMLLGHLGGASAPDEPVVLPTELIVRKSAP